ncbi:MAG: hypothetical protein WC503_02770 [Candidatus Shapirobacteria bacterium]
MSKFEVYLVDESSITDFSKMAKSYLLKIENMPSKMLKRKIDLNWKKLVKYLKKEGNEQKFIYIINKLFIKKYSSLNQLNKEMIEAYSSLNVNEASTVAGLLLFIKAVGPIILFVVEIALAIMSYGSIPKKIGMLQMVIFAIIGVVSLFAETYKEDIVGWLRSVKIRTERYIAKEE